MRELRISLLIISAVLASGQAVGPGPAAPPPATASSPATPLRFPAADVHLAPKTQDNAAISARATQFEMRNVTMLQLIARAYAMDADRIFGGPRWLELNKYVVIGKMPVGSKTTDAPAMLKQLLADRFGLVVHEDQRPLPAYVLGPGKGKHKLKQSDPDEKPICTLTGHPDNIWVGHLICHAHPISTFTQGLPSLSNNTVPAPVLDKTGLEGNWDIDIDFSSPGNMVNAGPDGVSLFDAVDKQLGLKLEKQMISQPVLVVDSVKETPTPNVEGISSLLEPPPQPATIEVATVKQSPPGTKGGGLSLRPEGKTLLLEAHAMRMSALLQQAWDIPVDRISGLPHSMDDRTFDIVAKIDLGTNQGLSSALVNPVLQKLLTERFHLKFHMQDKPFEAYRLVAVKPKMAVANPANRATCKSGTIGNEKDPRDLVPTRALLYTCRNLTMDEFAERLGPRGGISNGYNKLPYPVLNATKLKGMWDFTLNFSQATNMNITANSAVNPAVGRTTTDPTGELSLFDAITSQLGLKLELEKRMMPALVIDHVDEVPADN